MYAGNRFDQHPERAAFIMAGSGETVTYAELERRTNRLAHLLRAEGLRRLDHFAICMENNARYLECSGAGERSGLYYTCINSYLTAEELAYIVDNSEAQLLITSLAKLPVARAALARCPRVKRCLVVDGAAAVGALGDARFVDFAAAVDAYPDTPIADEALGTPMLYSSGTTGRPKGILRPLPDNPPSQPLPLFGFLNALWQCREGMRYLSPAPLYHSAPQANVSLAIRNGGTVVIMEHFDPEHYLALVEQQRITHTQLVPTMFSRLLKLPEAVRRRYDLSSLQIAVHAAAPCPVRSGADDRLVGTDHPRVLRRDRRARLHRLQQRRVAAHRAAQFGGRLHVLDARWRRYRRANRATVVQDRDAVRLFQRPGADQATRSATAR